MDFKVMETLHSVVVVVEFLCRKDKHFFSLQVMFTLLIGNMIDNTQAGGDSIFM